MQGIRLILGAAAAAAVLGATPAMAQSSVQCVMGADGTLEAALVWRNTLGTERANALCRTASPAKAHATAINRVPPGTAPSTAAAQPPSANPTWQALSQRETQGAAPGMYAGDSSAAAIQYLPLPPR